MATVEGFPAPKRMRGPEGETLAVYESSTGDSAGPIESRSSSLPSPTLQLTGHTGSVYQVQYSPTGATLCSTSFDMKCFLWSHYTEFQHENTESNASYKNFNVLEGHKNAVLDCAWCDEDCLVTCSADKTVMLWDATTGKRLRKWAEHTAVVNAVDRGVNETQVVSASDDRTCLVWDRRQKRPSGTLEAQFPVLAVAASAEHQQIYTSGIDPKIYAWDVRRLEHPLFAMSGHTDTVTSLAVHPHHDTHLLSNSMDQSLRSWDIRPFAGGTGSSSNSKRHYKTFQGHTHSAEKGLLKCAWSADGTLVSAGSSDCRVHIWDEHSTQELYDLPGHSGCVNAVAFHPVETTVIASGSSDQRIFVGELS